LANDALNPQSIRINLGTPGRLDGLTEFAGNSTAGVKNQNGYGPARLSTVSVNNEGAVVGMFSNGIKKNIAAVQITTFRDASALESVGNGYYIPSAGSGLPLAGRAMTNGAGAIRSGALEKSDSDVAADFANMIQARGGNPANGILRDLTSFIR
jgi:flagellar hook protein FlgE